MNRSMTLSANAALNEGGQGLNLHQMIKGLNLIFDLKIYSRSAKSNPASTDVPASRRADYISKLPLLRRLRDWQTYFSNVDFDRYVAERLEPSDIFQGVTGGCAESLLAPACSPTRTFSRPRATYRLIRSRMGASSISISRGSAKEISVCLRLTELNSTVILKPLWEHSPRPYPVIDFIRKIMRKCSGNVEY